MSFLFLGMSTSAAGIATGFAGGGFGGRPFRTGWAPRSTRPRSNRNPAPALTDGGSVKSGNTTHEGSVTEHDATGSTTYSYGVSEERKLKVGSEETAVRQRCRSVRPVSVTEHPDGSLTVTFDASVEGGVDSTARSRVSRAESSPV